MEDVEDIVHDMFLKFVDLGYMEKIDANSSPAAYVFGFVKMCLLDKLKNNNDINRVDVGYIENLSDGKTVLDDILDLENEEELKKLVSDYPDLSDWIEGELTQTKLADRDGITRQYISKKIDDFRKKFNKDSVDDPTHKNCRKCNKYLEINKYNFYKRDGRFSNTCCECEKERQREYYIFYSSCV
jgi:hypothetical protein